MLLKTRGSNPAYTGVWADTYCSWRISAKIKCVCFDNPGAACVQCQGEVGLSGAVTLPGFPGSFVIPAGGNASCANPGEMFVGTCNGLTCANLVDQQVQCAGTYPLFVDEMADPR